MNVYIYCCSDGMMMLLLFVNICVGKVSNKIKSILIRILSEEKKF